MQMDQHAVSPRLPCRGAWRSHSVKQACQELLRAKSAALLAAGKVQLSTRKPHLWRPQPDATVMDCYRPVRA